MVRDGWKRKLYTVFFELAGLNQQFEKRLAQLQESWARELKAMGLAATQSLKNDISAQFAREKGQLEQWFEKRLVEINNRHMPMQYNPIAYTYLTLDPPISDSEGVREYIHFHRHGESLRATETKDAGGDIEAWDRISRTERDIRILSFGKGPIKPFKEDAVHRQLLQLVICFESEHLTAEELAQCFDKYCTCGKQNHDADALRKMRDRFEAELKASAK